MNNDKTPNDFTLLEGLYQLAVTGESSGSNLEYERLNTAVYERLLLSYGEDIKSAASSANAMLV